LKKTDTNLEISKETPEFMFVKSGVQKIKVFFSEITHIQGLKDYAIIHADSGRIVTKGSIKFMQELFHVHSFVRVHKSFIVSKNRINRIAKNKLVIGNHHIPIGRNYKEELEKVLGNDTGKK
jgi:DNA-binding LytR/AlgR family response regulator